MTTLNDLLRGTAGLAEGMPLSSSVEGEPHLDIDRGAPDRDLLPPTEVLDELYESERNTASRVTKFLEDVDREFGTREDTQREWRDDDRHAARDVLERLGRDVLIDVVHSVDFVLELRSVGELLIRFPHVVAFLIPIAKGEALDRENHDGIGYHFHYVSTRARRIVRTNVLLTFDPGEASPPDTLYWEYHSAYPLAADPMRWGSQRTRAVYDAARPSLLKPGKTHFRKPARHATQLYSR